LSFNQYNGFLREEGALNSELERVSKHMLELGLGALAHANWHANFVSNHNNSWPELSVLQAAHAAEILIKARIAQKHPLLIFNKFPGSKGKTNDFLKLKQLFENSRTIQYKDLPERLRVTTDIELTNLKKYEEFGKLRNSIQHFAPPQEVDFCGKTIDFIYDVIDPFINECWVLYAIDYNEDDLKERVWLIESLIRREVEFLVSPKVLDCYEDMGDFQWPKNNPGYEQVMRIRFTVAKYTGQNNYKIRELKFTGER
jgi:hypothetical protein